MQDAELAQACLLLTLVACVHHFRALMHHHRQHSVVVCAALLPAAAETQDAELAQACLLVTLVVLAKGTVQLPAEPLRDQAAFKESMKSVSAAKHRGLGRIWGHAHVAETCSSSCYLQQH
jgi:hypothetical protein